VIFLSNNDPYINMENAKKYYSKLENVEFIDFKDK
jgi:predicted alpha/beta hydrolase family esterase